MNTTQEQLAEVNAEYGVEVSLSEYLMAHGEAPDADQYGNWAFLSTDHSTGDDDYLDYVEWHYGTLTEAAAQLQPGEYHLCS